MIDFQILHTDPAFVVVIKPPRVKSTDEPGGVPDLCRAALGGENFRTVHRLDQVVSGLMVLARTKRAASDLSQQIRDGIFHKEYQAVLHGCPDAPAGTLRDLLWRSKPERKTYVVSEPGKDVQEAILNYELLAQTDAFSRVRIELITGRTHQIRAQFAHAGHPLLGDGKYGKLDKRFDRNYQALYSYKLTFDFSTDAGSLAYLNGKSFQVEQVDFVEEYFPGTKI